MRNRVRVLEAAREVFGELGPEARMEEIAQRAGVGVGTLYRHFPTKEALLGALVSERLAEFGVLAEAALAEPDSWAAFEGMVWGLVGAAAEDRAMIRAFEGMTPGSGPFPLVEGGGRPAGVEEVIGGLLRRAQRDGRVRADVDAEDLRLMFSGVMIMALNAPRKDPGDEPWRRHVRVLLDGLRESSRGATDG